MQQVNEQELIRVINSHAKDISTLHCVIYGLLKQLRDQQGEEGLEAAKTYALEAANMRRPFDTVSPSKEMIRNAFDAAK